MKQLLILLTLSVAMGSALLFADEKKQEKIEGAQITFSLKDLDGKVHKSADMKDKIIVLEWTESGCPAVKPIYKNKKVQEAAAAMKKKGVEWFSVCSTHYNTVAGLKKFKESYKVDHKILQDFDGKLGKKIGAKKTPHCFVIKNGKVLYQGAFDDRRSGENYVTKAVEEILAGKEVSTPRTRAYG
ncbi:MAG: redoxin domain-containing protein [Planctomycetia bacterium]|nr:redoxin domain-containing protein [Planctomycetia bacterium]MBL6915177.1 redoxin domain-containing protein [Planctomycetota bacterium]